MSNNFTDEVASYAARRIIEQIKKACDENTKIDLSPVLDEVKKMKADKRDHKGD